MGLKVLHLIDSGGLYGAEKMLLALVKEQVKQGLEPMILSAGEPGIEEKPIEAEARRLNLPVTTWRMQPGLNLKAMKELVAWARQERFELFHSHGYKFNILLGATPKKKLGAQTIATLHGYVHAKRFSKMWVYELVDRWAIRRLDGLVLVSEAMRGEVGRYLGGRAIVIPNGLDVEAIQASAEKDADPLVQNFREARDSLIIGVGRLSTEKGFDRLIGAFSLYLENNPKAGLLIIGEGKQREFLEREIIRLNIQEAVYMPGYTSNVAACMRISDLLVIPSRTEGLPITLLEAMATKTLTVASAVGSIPAVLGNGQGGYIVEQLSPVRLADILEQIKLNPEHVMSKIDWAVTHVKALFSAEKMGQEYEEAYRKIGK